MRTNDGLLVALECLLDEGVEIGVFTNDPDGPDVRLKDLDEPKFYERAVVGEDAWKIDPKTQSASTKVTIRFQGKAMVTGYFIAIEGRLFEYELFDNPIPVSSKEDLIHLTPTIRVKPAK